MIGCKGDGEVEHAPFIGGTSGAGQISMPLCKVVREGGHRYTLQWTKKTKELDLLLSYQLQHVSVHILSK